ncbi:MAG: hypothetical protein ACE5PT_07710 [Gemmatimonadales bacterium]
MTGTVILGIIIAVLLGVLAWLFFSSGGETPSDGIAGAETREAEDEVQELDAFATPDEAEEELPDWGPGAPKT